MISTLRPSLGRVSIPKRFERSAAVERLERLERTALVDAKHDRAEPTSLRAAQEKRPFKTF
jgi:hypothetical protein